MLHGGLDPAESGGVQKNEDIVIYEDAPRGVRISLDEPTVSGQGHDTIDGFFSVVGSEHDDVITAGAETDVVRGLAGADTITVDSQEGEVFGGDGPDVMRLGYYVYGNNGDDDIRFAFKQASGGTGADVMVGTKHRDVYRAGPGGDVIRGRLGLDFVDGEEGSDRIVGGRRDDWMVGGSEDDQLAGGRGDDKLEPGDYAGSRRLIGDDVVRGGAGVDTVAYPEMYRAVGVRVDLAEGLATRAGHDLLYSIENASGGAGSDELLGSNVRNFLSGGEGDDLLRGRGGRDRLDPDNTEDDFAPLGNDTLHGGLGSDFASYWFARGGRGGVMIDLDAGTATGHGADTLGGIERLQGTSNSDQLLGDAHDNVLRGMSGDDVLVGRRGEDRAIGGNDDDSCDAEQMTGCET
jgi:Ca2+-binding RTX toxin-like protein